MVMPIWSLYDPIMQLRTTKTKQYFTWSTPKILKISFHCFPSWESKGTRARNKALITRLIKGQWWLMVPQLCPQLRHYFLGFYIGSRAPLDSHDSMLPPKKRGENLGSRNSWCSESSQAIFRRWWRFSCEVWVFQKEQPEVALAPRWCFQGRFSWNTFWSQELEVKWWNQIDEPILQICEEKPLSIDHIKGMFLVIFSAIINVARQAVLSFSGLLLHIHVVYTPVN